MEVAINQPIGLKINVLEIENRHASFKTKFELIASHPTGRLACEADDIWFECERWDEFCAALNELVFSAKDDASAVLCDMSDLVILYVSRVTFNSCRLNIEVTEPDTGVGTISTKCCFEADSEQTGTILNAFNDFPKWW